MTLGELIDLRKRFIFFDIKYDNSYRYTLDKVTTVSSFSDGLMSYARTLKEASRTDPQSPVAFSAFRTNNEDLLIPEGKMVPQCNVLLAIRTNAELLPGNNAEPT